MIAYSGEVTNGAASAAGPQVEKFAVPAGRLLGLVTIGLIGIVVVALVYDDPVKERGFICFGIAFVAVVWIVMVRPVVAVHARGLLLRNMLRDTFIPSAAITRARVGQILEVETPDKVYHGLGVSRSARSVMLEQRGGRSVGSGVFGLGQSSMQPRATSRSDSGPSYLSYMESRIQRLGSDAKSEDQRPVVAWAWTSVAALAIAVTAGLLAFVS